MFLREVATEPSVKVTGGRAGRPSTDTDSVPTTVADTLAVGLDNEQFADRVERRLQALQPQVDQVVAQLSALRRECAAERRAARTRLVAAVPDLAPLTPREVQVIKLAALDRDNTRIAADLVITAETVKGYWRDIYRRLGVHTRAGAVGRLPGYPPAGGSFDQECGSPPIGG